MALFRVEVKLFFPATARKAVATLRFDETNLFTGWPEVLRLVNGFLLKKAVR